MEILLYINSVVLQMMDHLSLISVLTIIQLGTKYEGSKYYLKIGPSFRTLIPYQRQTRPANILFTNHCIEACQYVTH